MKYTFLSLALLFASTAFLTYTPVIVSSCFLGLPEPSRVCADGGRQEPRQQRQQQVENI